jgi:polysaccharide deacetylase family protein (PEP-CTERM system associated)
MATAKCIFSVDVEDWFHILDVPGTPELAEWPKLESRVERNFRKLLSFLAEYRIKATCFFLGWVAEQYPHLVREAMAGGHEIASHGYSHQLVYDMTPDEFLSDISKAKAILEDITSVSVHGYRCSGFSILEGNDWYFDKLIAAGYTYDSSVFPAARGHGGIKSARLGPYTVNREGGAIREFPITVSELLGRRICFSVAVIYVSSPIG